MANQIKSLNKNLGNLGLELQQPCDKEPRFSELWSSLSPKPPCAYIVYYLGAKRVPIQVPMKAYKPISLYVYTYIHIIQLHINTHIHIYIYTYKHIYIYNIYNIYNTHIHYIGTWSLGVFRFRIEGC